MKFWLAALIFTFCWSVSIAFAQDPIMMYPPCKGGEFGHWQPYVLQNSQTKQIMVYMVIVSHEFPETPDYVDPAYIVCWMKNHQKVAVMPLDKLTSYGPLPALKK